MELLVLDSVGQLSVGNTDEYLEVNVQSHDLVAVGNVVSLNDGVSVLSIDTQPVQLDVQSFSLSVLSKAEQGPPGPPGTGGETYETVFEMLDDVTGYRGDALPGQSGGDPVWRLSFITINADLSVDYLYPNGDEGFNYVWDSRAGYSYA